MRSWKYVRRSNDITTRSSNRAAFVLGASAGLLTILLHSIFDFNMHIPANALVTIVLMALLAGHIRFATERFWIAPRLVGRILITVLCAVGAVYLTNQGTHRLRETYFWNRALRAQTFFGKVSLLKSGLAAEPGNFETAAELAETLRLGSWQGLANYKELAEEAMKYFQIAMRLNPFDPYNYMRYGMCLHWIGEGDKAAPYFQKAIARTQSALERGERIGVFGDYDVDGSSSSAILCDYFTSLGTPPRL